MQFITQGRSTNTSPGNRRTVIAVRVSIALVIVAIIAAVAWAVTALLNNKGGDGGITIATHVLPTHAKVRINGKQTEVKDVVHLAPGAYQIQASAEGFEDYTGSYLADASINKPVLAITLLPVSEEAKAYVNEHQQRYADQERVSGLETRQQSELFFQKNPITRKLPFSNLVYTIGYKRANPGDPADQSITIEISAPIGYRNAAANKIRELGYDPSDYIINFSNYVNPFKP